jgi:hypothetical protein
MTELTESQIALKEKCDRIKSAFAKTLPTFDDIQREIDSISSSFTKLNSFVDRVEGIENKYSTLTAVAAKLLDIITANVDTIQPTLDQVEVALDSITEPIASQDMEYALNELLC